MHTLFWPSSDFWGNAEVILDSGNGILRRLLGTACQMQGGPTGQMDFRPKGTFCHNMWCGAMGWAIHPCMRQRQFYHLIFRIFPKRWIWEKWRWNDCYFAPKSWAIHSLRDVFWFASSCAIQLSDGVSIVAYISYQIIIMSDFYLIRYGSVWTDMSIYSMSFSHCEWSVLKYVWYLCSIMMPQQVDYIWYMVFTVCQNTMIVTHVWYVLLVRHALACMCCMAWHVMYCSVMSTRKRRKFWRVNFNYARKTS